MGMQTTRTVNRKKGGNLGESLKVLVTYQKGCIYTKKGRSVRGGGGQKNRFV